MLRRRVNVWAGAIALGLWGLLVQDYFRGLEIEGVWLRVVLALLCLAILVTVVTWEPVWTPLEARLPFTVISKSRLKERRLSDVVIGQRCLELSDQLHEELADYRRDDPSALSWGLSSPRPGTQEYADLERATNEHRAKFQARYSQKYRRRAEWLLHEIEARGLADPGAVFMARDAETIGEPGVSRLAVLLGIVGHKLTEPEE